jgi:hypothetical protein
MQQIKIFEGNGNNESDVNVWLKENPNIEIQHIEMIPMFDRYGYGCGVPADMFNICNQWIATIVVYEEN